MYEAVEEDDFWFQSVFAQLQDRAQPECREV
jgi:hypothetical protein